MPLTTVVAGIDLSIPSEQALERASALALLKGKDVLVGVIDVATDEVETPQRVAQVIGEVMKFVPREKIIACTNCGMAPMRREIAEAKLIALGQGVALARKAYA